MCRVKDEGGKMIFPIALPFSALTWANLPANYHNGACGFSFADGHAEIRKWKDPDSLSRKIVANAKGPTDVPWLQVRTSAPIKDGTPWPP